MPDALIAQEPLLARDEARLMVLNRATKAIDHAHFYDLSAILRAGDALVINKARVSRAKVTGKKTTGGKVDVIFLSETEDPFVWKSLVRPVLPEGARVLLGSGVPASIEKREDNGVHWIRTQGITPKELKIKEGVIPLPPYIKRAPLDSRASQDEQNYQTVYASESGSVAAPTAGLHFSEGLLETLRKKKVEVIEIVLHVGWGTFKPVLGTIHTHSMLPEAYDISAQAYQQLLEAHQNNRRIFAVGTTTTRVLESIDPKIPHPALQGETTLFIKPGFQFKWLTGLITNFHVPRSTPLSLAAAFCGFDLLERAYHEAIQRKYRFYSYGDAMVIL